MLGHRVIIEPEREIPIIAEYDVIIGGGGPAGLIAAVASARLGARTLLVERYGFLGGMATAGLVTAFATFTNGTETIIEGIPLELIRRLDAMGGIRDHADPAVARWLFFDPELLKCLAFEMVEEAGVELLLHSYICRTRITDSTVQGIIVESKSGRQAILGQVVIDATGDGDIAAAAGAPFEKGRPSDGLMNPMSLMIRMSNADHERVQKYVKDEDPHWDAHHLTRTWAKAVEAGEITIPLTGLMCLEPTSYLGEYQVLGTRVHESIDGTRTEHLTRSEVEGRKQAWQVVRMLKNHVPGFENAYLSQTATQIGVRETRRVMGEYVLTGEDVLSGRKFPDAIARGCYRIDIHDPKGRDIDLRELPEGWSYDVPYRCLVPQKVDGLLVAGRCVSTTHEAMGSVRVMSHCMAFGHAAGVAAAIASLRGVQPRVLDAREVQKELLGQGANLGDTRMATGQHGEGLDNE